MSHQYWRAVVTLKDATHEWDVIVYPMYVDESAARRGLARFLKYTAPRAGYNVVKWWVELTPKLEVV